MKLTVITTPHHLGPASTLYLKAALVDSIRKKESPHAQNIFELFGEVVEDDTLGNIQQDDWLLRSDLLTVYFDLGIDNGMAKIIRSAKSNAIPTEWRWLGNRWNRVRDELGKAVEWKEQLPIRYQQEFAIVPKYLYPQHIREIHAEEDERILKILKEKAEEMERSAVLEKKKKTFNRWLTDRIQPEKPWRA